MNLKKGMLMGAVMAALAAGVGVTLAQAPGGGPGGGAGGPPGGGFGGGPGGGGPGMGGGRMGGGRGGRGGPPANLGAAMGDMNRMVTALKAEASDPSKSEQALKDLAQFERDVAIAKTMPVPAVDPATDAAKSATDFRNGMNTLLRAALDMEDAVVNKKPDVITKSLQTFADVEKAGHGEFRKSD